MEEPAQESPFVPVEPEGRSLQVPAFINGLQAWIQNTAFGP